MSIRQRLRPDHESAAWLAKHCADARFVYNLGLEQRNLWQRHRLQKVTTATQMKELAQARQANDWLRSGSSSVQQAALRDLDRAFRNWWKSPHHFAHPTWRRAGIHDASTSETSKYGRSTVGGARCRFPRPVGCGSG